jgi:UDP-glucose 4-epimerase
MMNRFCILGGAGFIGSHLADTLWNEGDVTVVDNFSAGLRENLSQFKDRRNFRILDRNIAGLGNFFEENKFDWVINLAAQVSTFESVTTPEKDFMTNAEGLFYVLEGLRKAKFDGTFIYTSSRSIYGDLLVPLANPNYKADENAPYKPSSIYNTNKYYGELLTKLYGQLYGLKYYIIRPSNVYGPRQPFAGQYNFICRWIAWALQNKPIPIWGKGDQVRDFVYVGDIVNGYLKVIQKKPRNDTFLLSSGKAHDLLDLATIILQDLDKPVANNSTVEFRPPKAGDIQRFVGDSTRAKTDLEWETTIDLESGIKKTISWVKDNLGRYQEYNL